MHRPLILIEFNELSFGVMERFRRAGLLPGFDRFHRESRVFTTEAEVDAPYLEPWIQWITVHSGLPYDEHRIFNLGDGAALPHKRIWDLVSDNGGKAWVCGSMNVGYQRPFRGWALPDPWMEKTAAQPAAELQPFVRFISANVREYTQERSSLTWGDRARFIRFMLGHGLSSATAVATAAQLLSELLQGGRTRWKRAAILDRLQFDLFRDVYRRERPDLSTFFANSTAHLQHLYWRNLEPERFHVQPSAAEQARYQDAIQFGYQRMDELLQRFLHLWGDSATLVFCTALSQQPCLGYEETGGKRWYRPHDFGRFLRDIGIDAPATVEPVMSHEFHIDFASEAAATAAAARLTDLRDDAGRQAMMLVQTGKRIFTGCQIFGQLKDDAVLHIAGSERRIPFFRLFYKIEGLKSGMHHPDGMLWIRVPERQHSVETRKIPLSSVAPTLLALLEIDKPAYMKSDSVL